MKKIALLYAWKSTQGWITTFYRDILSSFDKEKYTFDIFTVTEVMPIDIFSKTIVIKTPKWLLHILFKYNIHIPYSSLVMMLFYRKLKKYDTVIINQELAFPLGLFLKNDITILHGSTLMAMDSWYREKKYLYTLYYFFISFNTIFTYLVASKIYTVSNFTKKYIQKFNKNVEVCGLWVDQDFWKLDITVKKEDYGFAATDFLLIFVGRFDIWKGSDKIVNVMNSISKWNKNIKLIACVSRLPQDIEKYNDMGITFYHNLWKEEVRKLYSISDVFFFPTRYEWYGLVLAEALSIGLSVITSDIALGNLLKKSIKKDKNLRNNITILRSEDCFEKYEKSIYWKYEKFLDWEIIKKRPDLKYLNLWASIKNWVKII